MGVVLYEFLVGCPPFFGETPDELFTQAINVDMEWPDGDDALQDDAVHLISSLLVEDPMNRLGTGGSQEVKGHPYFNGIDWTGLLRQKAEFIPQLEGEEDTSYFDTRSDRYNHEVDTDEDESLPEFGNFSTCSPRYSRSYSSASHSSDDFERRERSYSASLPITEPPSSTSPKIRRSSLLTIMHQRSCSPSRDKANSKQVDSAPSSTPSPVASSSRDVSPRSRKLGKTFLRDVLPRFSISLEEDSPMTSSVESHDSKGSSSKDRGSSSKDSTKEGLKVERQSRPVVKSASSSGLSLVIPQEELHVPSPLNSPGESSTSSRDGSPSRDPTSPSIGPLKAPIVIKRPPRNKKLGFYMKAIRVYLGVSDVYTLHHLVTHVESNSPASVAGLTPGDLLTHINNTPIEGLIHREVVELLYANKNQVVLRAVPLENTTIKTGGKKHNLATSTMARRKKRNRRKELVEKRRKSSIIRRTSLKRTVDQPSPLSKGKSSLHRSPSLHEPRSPTMLKSPRSPPLLNIKMPEAFVSSTPVGSSQSSSPCSSCPNSPASHNQSSRPISLQGLSHKLPRPFRMSSNRRKSLGGPTPLSPLARQSSSPVPSSPIRSTSPLAINTSLGHSPGSSHTTQTFTTKSMASPTMAVPLKSKPKLTIRRNYETPPSRLLRQALSPDHEKLPIDLFDAHRLRSDSLPEDCMPLPKDEVKIESPKPSRNLESPGSKIPVRKDESKKSHLDVPKTGR